MDNVLADSTDGMYNIYLVTTLTDFHSNTIGIRNKKQNPMNLSVHDITQ